jgi:hypothetical protein
MQLGRSFVSPLPIKNECTELARVAGHKLKHGEFGHPLHLRLPTSADALPGPGRYHNNEMEPVHNTLTEAEVYSTIDQMVEANRLRCLWFLRPDYFPATNQERITTLRYLEKYGDRTTFIQARRLSNWLLQSFSEL